MKKRGPACQACAYMKISPNFRARVLKSNYFHPNASESVGQIMQKFKGVPFNLPALYRHLKLHEDKTQAPQDLIKVALESEVDARTPEHERALDLFITEFHSEVAKGNIKVRAETGLQAVRIKAEIESKKKDRTKDMLLALASMASPGGVDGDTNPLVLT